MIVFAHHVAVELLGREFSPRTPLEHAFTFAVVGFVLATSLYGTVTIARKASELIRTRVGHRDA